MINVRKMKSPMLTAGAAALALTAFLASPAYAQSGEGESLGVLSDIIVTAQRREQNLQDVPLSVASLGGQQLDVIMSGGVDVRALRGRVPSLNIESSFGRSFPRFYIRGLGNTDFDLNASQPVSLVYDDVVLESPILKGFPVFDLDRVEVLRGPQGTLFGRNTPAGIVKFESAKPTQELEGFGSLSWGRFNAVDAQGAISGPIIPGVLAARASVLYQRQDDWVDNLSNGPGDDLEGYEEVAARLQLLFTPTEQLSVLVRGQYRNLDGSARLFRANIFTAGSNDLNDNYDRDSVQFDGINFQRLEAYNLAATVTYDFGPATLTSVTSYWNGNFEGRGDIDGGFGCSFCASDFSNNSSPGFIPFSANSQDNVPSLDQFTQEVRLSSNSSGPLSYQAGVFYFDEKVDIETFDFPAAQAPLPWAIADQRQESTAWGIFASASYDVSEMLRLTAGVRYSDDERKLRADRLLDTRPGFLSSGPLASQTLEVDDSNVTWDVSANYFANDDVTLFARVATGFRAPSIQGRVAFGDTLSSADTEKTLSIEAGVKSTLADGRARVNAALFYTDVSDLQLTAVGGGSNFNRLINSDAELYGAEVEVEVRPVSQLLMTAGVSYNHTELTQAGLQVQTCGGGCTVTDPVTAGLATITGNPLPQAPEWTVNATARYGIPLLNDAELFFFTDWVYRSEVNFFLYDSVEFTGKALLEGGVRIGYQAPDNAYEVAAFVRNVTDTDRATGAIDFNNLTGFVNEPRTWGIQARFNF